MVENKENKAEESTAKPETQDNSAAELERLRAEHFGGLAKLFLWIFAWNGINDAWRLGGWIGIGLVAAAVALYLVVRSRRPSH